MEGRGWNQDVGNLFQACYCRMDKEAGPAGQGRAVDLILQESKQEEEWPDSVPSPTVL